MMNKSFFKVKKSCGDYGCHNNSFVSKAFLVIGDVHLAFFALRSLEPLFKIKRIVFLKISSRKQSILEKSDQLT